MVEKISLKLIFNITLFLVLINRSSSMDDQAKSSLINFVSKLSGDSAQANANLAWNPNSDPCKDWKGVGCDAGNKSIGKLFLDRQGFAGTLDAAIVCNVQSIADTLTVLNLDGNSINGSIADEIANCRQLSRLNVSGNRLSGDLPISLAMLNNLKGLDISNNNFSGTLPNLSRIPGLNIFLAQNNRLSGQIPSFDFSNLNIFNVSYNNFSGLIPDGGNRFSADTFQGNPQLCGNPLPRTCPALSIDNQTEGESKVPSKDQVIMYLGYSILGIIIISAILLMICKRRKTRQKIDTKTETASLEEGTKITSIVTSERKTNVSKSEYSVASESGMVSASLVIFTTAVNTLRFEDLLSAPAELLGRGKHGSLYKVKLDTGSSLVVKRIKDLTLTSNGFKRRMQVLDQVRHPNVLPALAYYCSKEEKLLVYEYQQNGSLLKLLHGKSKSFDWASRLNAASTICETLSFMHAQLKHDGIVHGNLKSSNILLNKNMEPCISEYGLKGTEQQEEDHETSFSFSNAHALGAISITFKADVYSFGVILLELLTGKLVQNDGVDLADWVHAVVKEEWTVEVFDRSLISEGASEERMVNLLQVAIKCVSNSPPSMNHVVCMINTIKEEEERSMLYEV